MKQEDVENISTVATPIFITISIHIGPTRLLEVSPHNAEYYLVRKLPEECTGADWVYDGKIKETMAANNNKEDDKENP